MIIKLVLPCGDEVEMEDDGIHVPSGHIDWDEFDEAVELINKVRQSMFAKPKPEEKQSGKKSK